MDIVNYLTDPWIEAEPVAGPFVEWCLAIYERAAESSWELAS
jgi:hypothetical protein